MTLLTTGRVCKKIAGREAGKTCVIISKPEGNFVLVDGEIKRRKCNINHLEPLSAVVKIKDNATTSDVLSALQNAGFDVQGRKEGSDTKAGDKPAKKNGKKPKEDSPKKTGKKEKKKPKK